MYQWSQMLFSTILTIQRYSKMDFPVYSCGIMLKKMFNKDNSLFENRVSIEFVFHIVSLSYFLQSSRSVRRAVTLKLSNAQNFFYRASFKLVPEKLSWRYRYKSCGKGDEIEKGWEGGNRIFMDEAHKCKKKSFNLAYYEFFDDRRSI